MARNGPDDTGDRDGEASRPRMGIGRALARAASGVAIAILSGWAIGLALMLPWLIFDASSAIGTPEHLTILTGVIAVGTVLVLPFALVLGIPFWLLLDRGGPLLPFDGAVCGTVIGLVAGASLGPVLGGLSLGYLQDFYFWYVCAALGLTGTFAGRIAVRATNAILPKPSRYP